MKKGFHLTRQISLSLSQKKGFHLTWLYVEETPQQWKQKMSRVGEWGDDVALNLACNVLGVTIVLVIAFEESPVIFRSLEHSNAEPLYLYYFSDSNFSPPHYESIRPGSSSTPSLVPVTLEEESLQEILVVDSLLEVPAVLDCQKQGRPIGSRNKKQAETSRPSCPDQEGGRARRSRGRPRGLGRGRGRGRGQPTERTTRSPSPVPSPPHLPDLSCVEEVRR